VSRGAAARSAVSFAPGVRERTTLLIGLAGGTGSGKTYSALALATGLAGGPCTCKFTARCTCGRRFAVSDTEARRALHYAPRKGQTVLERGQFVFDHSELVAPFRPQTYQDAIAAAEAARYPVVVVDSASHEWEGEGGMLEWQEEELDRMAGQDWDKRERCKMAAWVAPKMSHRRMVNRLLQLRSHLILCFRAEEKIEMARGKDGKLEIQPKKTRTGLAGWVPICEKRLPFELTASFLLTEVEPGFPKPIKLEEQHREFVDLKKPLDERVGAAFAIWAAGDSPPPRIDPAPPAKPAKAYSADELVKRYANCGRIEYEELENRRRELWAKLSGPDKRRLKQAADGAVERMTENEGKQLELTT
jgi:hypothetical protein